MKKSCFFLLALLCAVGFSLAQTVPSPLEELRYCGTPARDANGRILRSSAVIAAFKAIHPCPSTGKRTGACPGWTMDHVIPLACGGCDAVWNMQWLPNDQKRTKDAHAKDRYERRIYGHNPPFPGTENCTFATPQRTVK